MAENNDFNHIVRVANTDLVGEKQTADALRKIKGVNFMLANAICQKAGVDRHKQIGTISDADVKKIQAVIDDIPAAGIPTWLMNRRKDYESGEDMHNITNDLLLTHDNDLKRLKKIKTYRGLRHQAKLPVRGQRTKSNFRRNKGKKR